MTVAPAPADVRATGRLLVWLHVVGLAVAGAAAILHLGEPAAYACAGSTALPYLVCMRGSAARLRRHLLGFGLATGVVALGADWYLVSVEQTLRYGNGGPQVALSPAYMPLSWAGMTMSIGFLAWCVGRSRGPWIAALAGAALSGTTLPLYEILAFHARWWSYAEQQVFGLLPLHLVVAEILVGLPLPFLVGRAIAGTTWRTTIAAGLLAGLWICGVFVLAAALLG